MSLPLLDNDPLSVLIDNEEHLPQPPPTSAELKLAGQLREKIDHAAAQKKPRERNWEFNRLLLRGEQYIVQDFTTGDIVRMAFEEEANELLSVDNILLPTARAYVGKFIRIIPTCAVLPRTEDRSDLRAAEVIDSFLDFQWRNLGMKLKYKRSMEYLTWAGTSVFEPCWDQNKGRALAYCPVCEFSTDVEKPGTPCPVCSVAAQTPETMMAQARGAPAPQGPPLQRVKEGDISLTLHDPRDFFPEPGIGEIEEMQWAFTKTAQPINVLRRMFPDKAGLITAQDNIYTDRAIVYTVGTSLTSRYDTQTLRNHAYHYRIHLAPSGKNPRGLLIDMVNDRVMEVQSSPYYEMFDQLPFVAMRSDREARVFWGIPPIDNCGSLQKERNTLGTQTREHRELTNNPKVLIPENGGVDVDRWNTVAGEVIKWKPNAGGKPTYLQPPPLSQYVYAEFDRLAKAIRDKFGVTENEIGIAPPDQSGRSQAIIEAQSNEAIAPIVLENMEAWQKIHYFIALLGLNYYSPDRRWAIRGHDLPRSYSFGTVEDIRPGWNLMLADEDSLSKNPALRLQQSVMLLDKGVYNNPATGVPDMKKFMRHAGLRMPGQGPDDEASTRAYAAQIPELIRRGKPFQPKPWDDAVVCADELTVWLRDEGMNSPEPIVREVFNIWLIYTQAALAQGGQVRAMPNQALIQPPRGPQSQGTTGAPAQLPGGPGPGAQPTLQQEAGLGVQQADASAEAIARPGARREGATL